MVMALVQKFSDNDSDDRIPSKGKRGRSPNKEKLFRKKTSSSHYHHHTRTRRNHQLTNTKAISSNPQKRRKRCSVDSVYNNTNTCEAQLSIYQRAKEIQDNLSPHFLTLLKCMLPSHVTGGFWLGLPKQFCDLHLPISDTIITLEDESGKLYETKYLAQKMGLSGGWRGFSLAHNLLETDVLIFHLLQPSKFKVYIIRSQGLDEMGGALGLLKLNNCSEQNDEVDGAIDATEGNDPSNSGLVFDAIVSQPDQPENENTSGDLCSEEVRDGIGFSESVISFKEVTGIENFHIIVNGLVIDSELPKHVWSKYYELCCSQGSFLHEHLIEGLNCKLVSGMIAETISIADAIKASNISTISPDSLVIWEKTLKAFEGMGMNVSFLLIRLEQLTKAVLKSKRYKESRIEREHAQEELKKLIAKLVEVKESINRLDEEIVDTNPQRLEIMFQELANAPW